MTQYQKKNSYSKTRFSFFKKEEGATIIEFAILVPTFILLIFGVINIGLMMVIENALEAAVREASRYGITGASQTNMTRGNSILQVINNVTNKYSGGIINANQLTVTVLSYPDLTAVSGGSGQSGSYGTGGQAVLYKLSYPWDTFFNIFGTGHAFVLRAQTPVMNEQFSSS